MTNAELADEITTELLDGVETVSDTHYDALYDAVYEEAVDCLEEGWSIAESTLFAKNEMHDQLGQLA